MVQNYGLMLGLGLLAQYKYNGAVVERGTCPVFQSG